MRSAIRSLARRQATCRLMPAERLVRARHAGVGISAARAVPRQELSHHHLAVGRHARGVGAVPNLAAARPAGNPAPLWYLLDAADQATGALDIDLEVLLLTDGLRSKQLPAAGFCRQRTPSLLDCRPIGRPSRQRRLQSATGRCLRDRHDLGAARRRPRQPAGDFRGRPAAGCAGVGRKSPFSGGRRHRDHARALPA